MSPEWEGALNDAAVQLVAGAGSDEDRLRAVQQLLLGVSRTPAPAPGAAGGIERALAVIAAALAGGPAHDAAAAEVGRLLEDVLNGVDSSAPPGLAVAAPELVPAFVAEARDALADAERALLELETDPAAAEPVHDILRAFHSIKGSAAVLGLHAVSALAHAAESQLAPVRDGGVSFGREHADLLLSSADRLRELLANVEGGAAVDPSPRAPASAQSSAEAWARVSTLRLDQLVDLVGELAVAHSMIAQDALVQGQRQAELGHKVQRASRMLRELHDLSIGLRMVPLRPLFQRLQRQVRDLSHGAGKEVHLVLEGEETEIDRTMVDALTDPLVHMIRNAIDHGLETTAEREALGKPVAGTLRLRASHAAGAVLVELSDDGRGLDRARIRARAEERCIVSSGQPLSDADVDALIFEPGLSTCSEVTEISGRGVGMDVVRRNVESLRGRIEIASTPGAGTCFTLRLPLTLALTDGMVVRVGEERYIVPTFSIETTFRPVRAALVTEARGGELVLLHGEALPLVRLHHVFGVRGAVTDPAAAVLAVVADGVARYALLVDELVGQQQFVAKPLPAGLAEVPGLAGSAILGDGRVGLILDPAGLLAGARQLPPWRERAA